MGTEKVKQKSPSMAKFKGSGSRSFHTPNTAAQTGLPGWGNGQLIYLVSRYS